MPSRKRLTTRRVNRRASRVLVMRDDDKVQARTHFQTPLIFSITKPKDSNTNTSFSTALSPGIAHSLTRSPRASTANDLADDILEYRRARDKTDRSLEVYKFYVNALYVALTPRDKTMCI